MNHTSMFQYFHAQYYFPNDSMRSGSLIEFHGDEILQDCHQVENRTGLLIVCAGAIYNTVDKASRSTHTISSGLKRTITPNETSSAIS